VAGSTASRTLTPDDALRMHWRRLQALAAANIAGGYTEDELLKRFRRFGTSIWAKLDKKLGGSAAAAAAAQSASVGVPAPAGITARFAVGLPYLSAPFLFPGPRWSMVRATADAAAAAAAPSASTTAAVPAAGAGAPLVEEPESFFFAAAITARSDITATPR
jgi:hypothetical protein